jgi:hypothetical protein
MNVHVSADPITLRASSLAITTSYDAAPTEVPCNDYNQLILECKLALNTATDARIEIEAANPARGPNGATVAPVAADWFVIAAMNASSASSSGATLSVPYQYLEIILPATGSYSIAIPIAHKYIRVKAKTTAGPGSTTLAIDGVFGRV